MKGGGPGRGHPRSPQGLRSPAGGGIMVDFRRLPCVTAAKQTRDRDVPGFGAVVRVLGV